MPLKATLCLLLLLLSSSLSLAATGQSISVPNGWRGNIVTDDQTGQFSYCMASADYVSGTSLWTSIDRNYLWQLAFFNPAWKLGRHYQISVSIQIDGYPKGFTASTGEGKLVFITIPNDQEMINLFRFGRVMRVKFNANTYNEDGSISAWPISYDYEFELNGTAKLLVQLSQCVKDQLSPPTQVARPDPKPAKEAKSPEPKEKSNKKREEPTTSTGTGVIVTNAGHILTNYHVVEDCKSIVYSKEGELTQRASILRSDKTNDLAVLKSETSLSSSDVASFRITPPVKAGEQIAVYGFPLTGLLSLSGNVVSGNVSSLAGIGDDVRFFQVSAPVQPGNSGGPLLDLSGNIVGIVTARIDDFVVAGATGALPQNVNFAIKSQIATSFMDTHGVEYRHSNSISERTLASVVDAAKKFTVLIECKRD